MHLLMHKPSAEDEDAQNMLNSFSLRGTEDNLVEFHLFPKAEACIPLAMKQDEEGDKSLVKGKEICSDEDAGLDEGIADKLKNILASDECIDNPVNNVDNKDEVDFDYQQKIDTEERVKIRKRRDGNTSQEKMHHTKFDLFSIFVCVFATVSLLMKGRPLAVKPTKKAFHLIILILSGFFLTAASPIQQNPETGGLSEYKLLHTPTCNYGGFIRSETCERNEAMMDIYNDFCGFADLCDPGFKPVCVNGDDGEMLHICSPKGLACPKGYRKIVSRKAADSSVVLVQEEKCPNGRYQPYESNCYDACATRHEDIKILPAQYAIYSKGDNISPPMIYCDFEHGYYNLDGKFLQKYDEEIKHHPFDCTNVTDHNPCSRGLYPIPNGTCVSPCEEGFKRDVHDDFQCKELRWAEIVSSTEEKNMKDSELIRTSEEEAEINISNMTSQNLREDATAVDSHVPDDSHVTIVIVLVCAALLLAIVGLVVVLLEH